MTSQVAVSPNSPSGSTPGNPSVRTPVHAYVSTTRAPVHTWRPRRYPTWTGGGSPAPTTPHVTYHRCRCY